MQPHNGETSTTPVSQQPLGSRKPHSSMENPARTRWPRDGAIRITTPVTRTTRTTSDEGGNGGGGFIGTWGMPRGGR